MLSQHEGQWAGISPTLDQRVVFARDKLNVVRRAVDAFLGHVVFYGFELSDSSYPESMQILHKYVHRYTYF